MAKVTTLEGTFGRAAMFEGTGLKSWDIASVTTLSKTFMSTTSLTTCNKRKIADAWKSSAVFVATSYGTDWAGETCPKVRDDCEERCGAMCRSRVCMRCRTLLVQMRTVVCKVERIVWGDVKIRASSRGGERLCISANATTKKQPLTPPPCLPPLLPTP